MDTYSTTLIRLHVVVPSYSTGTTLPFLPYVCLSVQYPFSMIKDIMKLTVVLRLNFSTPVGVVSTKTLDIISYDS